MKHTHNEFELAFLKSDADHKNLVYSPLAIQTILELLADGADGKTRTQIDSVIPTKKAMKFGNVDEKVSQANGLFLVKNHKNVIKEDYIRKQKEKYDIEVFTDVQNAKQINKWFKEKTFGMIPEMVEHLSSAMAFSLASALAIDLNWKEQFNGSVGDGDFYYKDKEYSIIEVNSSFYSDAVAYSQKENLTVLSMDLEPCGDMQLEYIALMPKDLDTYLDALTLEKLEKDTTGLKKSGDMPNGIHVTAPRFSFDYAFDLKKAMESLGIIDVFDPEKANLSMMSDAPLYVSEALHKAKIEFSEKGIKAGAACHMDMCFGIPCFERPYIVIDRPFLFVIRDKQSGAFLFVGTVYEPECIN